MSSPYFHFFSLAVLLYVIDLYFDTKSSCLSNNSDALKRVMQRHVRIKRGPCLN